MSSLFETLDNNMTINAVEHDIVLTQDIIFGCPTTQARKILF